MINLLSGHRSQARYGSPAREVRNLDYRGLGCGGTVESCADRTSSRARPRLACGALSHVRSDLHNQRWPTIANVGQIRACDGPTTAQPGPQPVAWADVLTGASLPSVQRTRTVR